MTNYFCFYCQESIIIVEKFKFSSNFVDIFCYITFQVDKQLATGEYFLNKEQKRTKQQKEKEEKHAEATKKREERRQQAFVAPEEPKVEHTVTNKNSSVDIDALKEKVKKAQKRKFQKTNSSV